MLGHLTGFAFDRGGNFGIISAVIAVPLVLSVGMALDYSSISSTQERLQQAIEFGRARHRARGQGRERREGRRDRRTS